MEALPKNPVKPKEVKPLKAETGSIDKILNYLNNRKDKKGRKLPHRYDREYLNLLYKHCNQDIHYVRLYVAISGHESVFGTKGHANDKKGSNVNYIGWMHWPNGKRAIRDYESREQFIKHVCKRFTNKKMYHGDKIITRQGTIYSWNNVRVYSGSDRATVWGNTVLKYYRAMM